MENTDAHRVSVSLPTQPDGSFEARLGGLGPMLRPDELVLLLAVIGLSVAVSVRFGFIIVVAPAMFAALGLMRWKRRRAQHLTLATRGERLVVEADPSSRRFSVPRDEIAEVGAGVDGEHRTLWVQTKGGERRIMLRYLTAREVDVLMPLIAAARK